MINFADFKKFFFACLIGSLIIAALTAVVTVLVGSFNDIAGKVLLTLLMVIIHALISLAFIWDNEKQNTFERFNFFTNVLFIIIILSFLVSIFGLWDLISGDNVWHTYQTFFILLFAALHGDILSKALDKEGYLDTIIYINYLFMGIVVIMLLPLIYMSNPQMVLGEFYYRLLAATAIIDGTLSILAIIFYKAHMHKYPKEESLLQNTYKIPGTNKTEKKGLSIWVWILIIYLIIQVGLPLLFVGLMAFA